MSALLFVMKHTAERCALTRKLRVDLQGSGLFGVLLLKYRLLNRQIVHISRPRGDVCLHRRLLHSFAVKAVQLHLPQGTNLLLRLQ